MYSITKNCVALDPKLYTIDEANQTFASEENGLVIDFTGEDCWFFKIGDSCTITTGDHCTINTYSGCNITAGERCTINTSHGCNITTGDKAVVVTYGDSTITGGENCVLIRHYTSEVIKLVAGQTIKLNDHMTEGYTIVEPIETTKEFNKRIVNHLENLKPIN